jgi:hypothetical protein
VGTVTANNFCVKGTGSAVSFGCDLHSLLVAVNKGERAPCFSVAANFIAGNSFNDFNNLFVVKSKKGPAKTSRAHP